LDYLVAEVLQKGAENGESSAIGFSVATDGWVVGSELMICPTEEQIVDGSEQQIGTALTLCCGRENRNDLIVFGDRERQPFVKRGTALNLLGEPQESRLQ
jgi:hypothetical protein